jgi:hypothetical protein
MNHHEDQAAYEAALCAQAEHEAAMNAQAQAYFEQARAYGEQRDAFLEYLHSLIHQEKFQLLSIEIVLDMIREEYSEESGKTIVEFLNEERLKLVETPNPQTNENPRPNP